MTREFSKRSYVRYFAGARSSIVLISYDMGLSWVHLLILMWSNNENSNFYQSMYANFSSQRNLCVPDLRCRNRRWGSQWMGIQIWETSQHIGRVRDGAGDRFRRMAGMASRTLVDALRGLATGWGYRAQVGTEEFSMYRWLKTQWMHWNEWRNHDRYCPKEAPQATS